MSELDIPYQLKLNRRLKRVRLYARHDHVIVETPTLNVNHEELEVWMARNRQRLLNAIERESQKLDQFPLPIPGQSLVTGTQLPLLGRTITLEVKLTARRTPLFTLRGDQLLVYVNSFNRTFLAPHLKKWYQQQIEPHLDYCARTFRSIHGLGPKRFVLKDNVSNWGSCSSKGNINLSWRLIFAPESVLHNIIFHELTHLIHHHHGPQFHQTLEALHPTREVDDLWLSRHGHGLHHILPADQ